MTWDDIDKLKRDHPRKLRTIARLDGPGWRAFAELEGRLRFYGHAADVRIAVRRPCAYVPGKWRSNGVAEPRRRPEGLRVLAPMIGCLNERAGPRGWNELLVWTPIPWNTWRAVLVACDSWREAGCPVMRPPTRVEWLP